MDLAPFCYCYFWGVVTFGWLKCVLHMGTSKIKSQKMWKEYFLKKGNVYPVLYELWIGMSIIINKAWISGICSGYLSYPLFLQKGKYLSVLKSLLSEDRYFRGDCYFRDLLTPVTFYLYFRRFPIHLRGHYFQNFTVVWQFIYLNIL